jgi:alkanesulfonate monooxygenase SsuD/methylene tetrahydromethanopterin reductase-like flavin-dependent oxidoreductase (luciferase family)
MRLGVGITFQNYGESMTDHEVYQADLAVADLAEPLGFDSVWGLEHHFTGYAMCPDPIQFLTFMAARTERVQLGSMVAVLPWHDPLRLAEQIIMLDNLSNGRVILGMGRGTGKIEFDAFGINMGTARKQFKEAAEAIMSALETGVIEYDGEIVKQPRAELRPRPFKSFKDRLYSATISPESAEIMARLGTGILIIPQKPWPQVKQECESYRTMYEDSIGTLPPPPIVAGWTYVDSDADRAEERARKWIGAYWDSVVEHYEFDKPHLANTPGYEFHVRMYEGLMAPGGKQKYQDDYVALQAWGTSDQVYDKVVNFSNLTSADTFVPVFRYAGMPLDEARASMRLFASEVMPELRKYKAAASTRAA